MEEAYRASLFKSFTKTLEDGFFPVVIVDAIHDKVRLDMFSVDCLSCLEMWHYAVRSACTVKNEVSDIKAICTNMSLFQIYRLSILTNTGVMQSRKVLRSVSLLCS